MGKLPQRKVLNVFCVWLLTVGPCLGLQSKSKSDEHSIYFMLKEKEMVTFLHAKQRGRASQ